LPRTTVATWWWRCWKTSFGSRRTWSPETRPAAETLQSGLREVAELLGPDPGIGDFEADLVATVALVESGGTPAPELIASLEVAYLYDWIAEIDAGLGSWGRVGLSVTRGLFEAQTRRDVQNELGRNVGSEVDPARADVEADVDVVDAVLAALDDPDLDGNREDSFIDNHLLPMLGVPTPLIDFGLVLGGVADLLDDQLLGPLRVLFNPVRAAGDEIAELAEDLVRDLVQARFGFDVDILEFLLDVGSKMDLASITLDGTSLEIFSRETTRSSMRTWASRVSPRPERSTHRPSRTSRTWSSTRIPGASSTRTWSSRRRASLPTRTPSPLASWPFSRRSRCSMRAREAGSSAPSCPTCWGRPTTTACSR
jgi:hypothetical protein